MKKNKITCSQCAGVFKGWERFSRHWPITRDQCNNLAAQGPAADNLGARVTGAQLVEESLETVPGTPVTSERGVTAQPPPQTNYRPPIQELVRVDLLAREKVGIQRYGTPLQAHNGRDALVDLYEELLDSVCYIRQVIEERDS